MKIGNQFLDCQTRSGQDFALPDFACLLTETTKRLINTFGKPTFRPLQFLRKTLLALENKRRLRNVCNHVVELGTTPIFFIFTPEIVHFAPYCIPRNAAGFEPILILNSVSADDEQWLKKIYPQFLIISLKVSLSGNPNSLLAHGVVLDLLFATMKKPFCIQDPDCFVTDSSFWSLVKLEQDVDFACGPFAKSPTDHRHVLPDTFFLILNPSIFKEICGQYKMSAVSESKLNSAATDQIQKLGYGPGQYPEKSKGYFDTLQAYWVLALSKGYRFSTIPGAGKTIFHLGGASYLHSSDIDLRSGYYWPLGVIFFNLRLLELPAGERFRDQFKKLFQLYESSESLLKMFPDFANTWRFEQLQTLFANISDEKFHNT